MREEKPRGSILRSDLLRWKPVPGSMAERSTGIWSEVIGVPPWNVAVLYVRNIPWRGWC
ncbi:hypothetical protein X777_09185 [Ooceraea biroi]|uniref:Uncharacterized protein n=1 Tax=Ooceraea biroi TaxID=2015173 RepID=A0A026W6Z8_OOCBI|nr:hypothetical protein X777_09185 [Ooceraea biroi]